METNLFIKSAKVDHNKVTDIDFYGDWEIDLGGGGGSGQGSGILVGDGKTFITDTQDTVVSIRYVNASSFAIKVMYRKLNAGSMYYKIACVKYKNSNSYSTLTEANYTNYSFDIETFNNKPADIDNVIIMFFSEAGDYICGYKYTSEYLQSLM